MIISFIVAAGENNEIGLENDLPWRMPEDMKFFKETTLGHCVLMGSKTFESFGSKPLKNRTNIIVTRRTNYVAEGGVVVNSVEEGIEYARQQGETELFIIGGGQIFEKTLPLAHRIYFTKIHHTFTNATVHFPELNPAEWTTVREEKRYKDERHAYDYTFYTFERKN